MKLTKQQQDSKRRLNKICDSVGFEKLRSIVYLSGSSLGQYLAYDSDMTIPEVKLKLAEIAQTLK